MQKFDVGFISAFLSPSKKKIQKIQKFSKKMSEKSVVGERCKIRGRSGNLSLGRVAFVGPVHYAKGEFVGIVLDRIRVVSRRFSNTEFTHTRQGTGKNNGTIKGKGVLSV